MTIRRGRLFAGDHRLWTVTTGLSAMCLSAMCLAVAAFGAEPDPGLEHTIETREAGVRESRYGQLPRMVIRLERSFEVASGDTIRRPMATAFFVDVAGDLFIVTARHVVEGDEDLLARVPTRDHVTDRLRPLELHIPSTAWIPHPSAALKTSEGLEIRYVDVAVARLPWPDGVKVAPLDHLPAPENTARVDALDVPDPLPITQVLSFGYPRDLGINLVEQRPVARSGVVSMVSPEAFLPYRRDEKGLAGPTAFAVDIRSFPGNSGSPIFLAAGFDEKPILVGLIAAGYERLDLAIAEPVSTIRQALAAARRSPQAPTASWRRGSP